MIQIDDAGSGSLVGGTMIGVMRVETKDFYSDVIPIKYFTSPNFEEKKYTDFCINIIDDSFKALGVEKNELIQICQGYIFDKVRKYLTDNGYSVISTKISEPLQSVIEENFMDYVIGLGIPLDYLQYTKYPFHFHRLLKWVFADIKTREKLCKTGWKSWKKYKDIKISHYSDSLLGGNYRCLKCGNIIETPCKIKIIKFTTNHDYFIYVHDNCHSSQ